MPQSNAERQRLWRQRQAAGEQFQRQRCSACGEPRTDAHAPLCSRCWLRLTPEGIAYNRERSAIRARRMLDRRNGMV